MDEDGDAPGPSTLHHQALVYRDLDGFLAGIVPFVREGLERGDPVAVVVGPDELASLRAEIGPVGDALWADTNVWQTRPAGRLRTFHRMVSDAVAAGAPAIRLIGEPQWPGGSDGFAREWVRYESLLNRVLAPYPVTLVCTYPASRLTEAIVSEAGRTHPVVALHGTERASAGYEDPRELLPRLNPPLGAVPSSAIAMPGPIDPPSARAFIASWARHPGLGPGRTADLTLAVSEVVANAGTHGGGISALRVWTEEEHALCQVDDAGVAGPDPLAGYLPPSRDLEAGRGLWLARQVVDLLRIVSGPGGTSARMYVRLARR